MWKEFRQFAARGNVIDLAVGVIIGAAFGKIVSSLVTDIVMPPIGLALGRVDFKNLYRPARRPALRLPRRGAKGRRAHHQLRHLPEHRRRVRDRGVRGVPDGSPDQQADAAPAGSARRAAPRLPGVRIVDPRAGAAVSVLYGWDHARRLTRLGTATAWRASIP